MVRHRQLIQGLLRTTYGLAWCIIVSNPDRVSVTTRYVIIVSTMDRVPLEFAYV